MNRFYIILFIAEMLFSKPSLHIMLHSQVFHIILTSFDVTYVTLYKGMHYKIIPLIIAIYLLTAFVSYNIYHKYKVNFKSVSLVFCQY